MVERNSIDLGGMFSPTTPTPRTPSHSRSQSKAPSRASSPTPESRFSIDSEASLCSLEIEQQDPYLVGLLGQPSALLCEAEQHGKSTLYMAFVNMANSIMGAGIIGQPYAMRRAGLLTGIILLVVLTFLIDWTIRLMVTNAKLSGRRTYQSIVQYSYGKLGLLATSLAQGFFAFGGAMAYCIIIGDTLPHVLSALFPKLQTVPVLNLLTMRNPVIFIVVMFISYPLSLHRNIGKLAKASALALVSMVVITLTVAIRGPAVGPRDLDPPLSSWILDAGVFQAVSVISFAFVCHHNILIIYNSLKTPSMERFAKVTHWSTGVSMVSCMIMGVFGYVSFKTLTMGNILNNFPKTDVMANVARFCFGFNMVTTLPLEIFVCREVLQELLYPDQNRASTKQHVAITTFFLVAAMGVALFTCNLGVVLELVGSLSACTLAYILPPICYLKLSSKQTRSRDKIISYACATFGAVALVISTTQTIAKVIRGLESATCVQ